MMILAMSTANLESCTPNISTPERQKRLYSGGISLVIGVLALAGLIVLGFNPWWRLALFPVFASAATGYFQWRDMT